MKTIISMILIWVTLYPSQYSFATISPSTFHYPADTTNEFKSGRFRPGLFQKLGTALLLKKIRKKVGDKINPKQKRQARVSMILGLISFALLFAPFGLWFSLPAAIAALIFGIKSVNGNSNIEGIIGIVSSGITLSIFLIVGLVLLIVASSRL